MNKLFDITPRKIISKSNNSSEKSNENSLFYLVAIIAGGIFAFSIMQNTNVQGENNQQQKSESNNQEIYNEQTRDNKTDDELTPATLPDDSNSNYSQQINQTPIINDINQTDNQINKSEISIHILNGSGSSGVAAKTKEILESDGYKIESIGTANNIYSRTVIYYNKNKEAQSRLVAGSLPNDGIKFEEDSNLTEGFDLLIVVGRE